MLSPFPFVATLVDKTWHAASDDTSGSPASNSLALFMVPGMGHCRGGPGTDVFDKVAALDRWIETG